MEITTKSAQLALDTILQKPTKGIASWGLLPMEHEYIERFARAAPGDYKRYPEKTYIAMMQAFGTCMLDQYIPDNPLTMGSHGYEGTELGATTGVETIVLDGTVIDSPEAVVEHMERFLFKELQDQIANFDEDKRIKYILDEETVMRAKLGPEILKVPYGYVWIPGFEYGRWVRELFYGLRAVS